LRRELSGGFAAPYSGDRTSTTGRLGEFAQSGSSHPHAAGHAGNIDRSLCERSGRSWRGPSSGRSRRRPTSGPRAL